MSMDAATSPVADSASLPGDAPALQALVQQLQAREAQLTAALNESSQTVTAQQQLLDKLTHELALMKRWMFGSRRERFDADDPRQKSLFEVSAEPTSDAEAEDESRDDES